MEDNKFKTHYEFKEDVIIQIPNDQYSKGIENGHNTIWKSTTFTGSIIALVSTLILSTWLEIIILKYYLPSLNRYVFV
jgi:hypothetical protein